MSMDGRSVPETARRHGSNPPSLLNAVSCVTSVMSGLLFSAIFWITSFGLKMLKEDRLSPNREHILSQNLWVVLIVRPLTLIALPFSMTVMFLRLVER